MLVSVSLIKISKSFDYILPTALEGKVTVGTKVKVPFGKTEQLGFISALNTQPKLSSKIKLKEILGLAEELPFPSLISPLAEFLTNTYANTLGEALNALKPAILTKKLLSKKSDFAAPALPLFYANIQNPKIKEALDFASKQQKTLFYGSSFTPSEAALFVAHKTLAEGGQVLVLVPDVVSSSKLITEIKQKLGAQNILLWHSKVLLSERKKTVAEIYQGKPCVVVGTRSAVLLPFKNLKLSLMFYEEDKLFKQEEMRPYYHAREVLFKRAELEGGKVILISSAPSLEALKNTSLFNFEDSKAVSKVQILPLEYTVKNNKFISPQLALLLVDNFNKGKQSLLLINRLGFAGAYSCVFCNTLAKCKKCGAVLSHQKTAKGEILFCKKCGAKESVNQICPRCQNQIFRDTLGGTQAVEEELKHLFKEAKVLRLDSQTLAKIDLKKINFSDYDFIVGTALSLRANFQKCRISLAAVLDGGAALKTADFRAGEHFAQTLYTLKTLLAGEQNPRLIVQIKDKNLFDFPALEKHNYLTFAKEELEFRKEFNFPPYAKLVHLILTAKKQEDLNTYGAAMEDALKGAYADFMEIEGPVLCGAKSKNFAQCYYLIKSKNDAMLASFLHTLRQNPPPKKLELKVLADPYNFV